MAYYGLDTRHRTAEIFLSHPGLVSRTIHTTFLILLIFDFFFLFVIFVTF